MNLDDFFVFFNCCKLSVGNGIVAMELKDRIYAKLIDRILATNNLHTVSNDDNIPTITFENWNKIAQENGVGYSRRLIEMKKSREQFLKMTPSDIEKLSLPERISYLKAFFPIAVQSEQISDFFPIYKEGKELKRSRADFTQADLEKCVHFEKRILPCLSGLMFSDTFIGEEQKKIDKFIKRFLSDKTLVSVAENWHELDTSVSQEIAKAKKIFEKKMFIEKTFEIFKEVYGMAPEIGYFTCEQFRSSPDYSEGMVIPDAKTLDNKISFNEDRLNDSHNFFAVSLIIHEGMHLRQYYDDFNNETNDILKSPVFVLSQYWDTIRPNEKEIYTILPTEVHAYAIQQYLENSLEINGIHRQNGTSSNTNSTSERIKRAGFERAKELFPLPEPLPINRNGTLINAHMSLNERR